MISTPSFLIETIALITSSDSNKLYALDFPIACEANKTHLIDNDLSPGTFNTLLKLGITEFIDR